MDAEIDQLDKELSNSIMPEESKDMMIARGGGDDEEHKSPDKQK